MFRGMQFGATLFGRRLRVVHGLPVILLIAGVGWRMGSGDQKLDTETDTCVSYLQAAEQLGVQLLDLKTPDDLLADIPTAVMGNDERRLKKDVLAGLLAELESYQNSARKVAEEKREQVAKENADLVTRVRDMLIRVEESEARLEKIVGANWDSYLSALQVDATL